MRHIPLLVWLILPAPSLGISLHQVDDFQTSTQGWTTGSANPTPPVRVSDGGPDGSGDSFLRVEGNGGSGSGSNLVAFNTEQWSGDYLAAGVGAISAELRNLGPQPLAIRLLLEGPGGAFLSASGVALPANAGWERRVFPIGPGALVGGRDLEATLADVTKLRILHAPTLDGSEPVQGVLGVDDLTGALAVPEPKGLRPITLGILLVPTWAALAVGRRRVD